MDTHRRLPAGALVLLGLIIALAALLRLARLEADPPLDLSMSHAEVMDGAWYLAEAADAVRGQPVDVPPEYRRPLYTVLARFWFGRIVSLAQANAFAATGGILLVVGVFLAARRAFGTSVGLVAALFAAASFVTVGYGRTPVVYGWLAAGMTLTFWLFLIGLERPVFAAGAWVFLGILGVGLKETALPQLAPALAVGHLVAARRRGRALAGLLATAVALGLALWLTPGLGERLPGKILAYVGAERGLSLLDLAKRLVNFAPRSRLPAGMPGLALLGWLGVLLVTARPVPAGDAAHAAARRERAARAALAAWVVATILTGFPIVGDPAEGGTHPPLRYFMPAAVPLVILAADTLLRLQRGFAACLSPLALAPWGLVLGYTLAYGGFVLAHDWLTQGGRPAPGWFARVASFWGLLALAAVFALVVTWLGSREGGVLGWRGSAATAALVGTLVLAPDAVRVTRMLAAPEYSFRDANRAVARRLGPGSRAIGNWAHALTWEAPHVTRTQTYALDVGDPATRARLRGGGFTHLVAGGIRFEVLERAFRELEGAPLALVGVLRIRGEAEVRVYRFPWVSPP